MMHDIMKEMNEMRQKEWISSKELSRCKKE
jgi:hypothetical protein